MKQIVVVFISVMMSVLVRADQYPLEIIDFDGTMLTIQRKVAKIKGLLNGIGIGYYEDPGYHQNDLCLAGDQIDAIYNVVEVIKNDVDRVDRVLK